MSHEAFEPEQDAEVLVTPIRRRPRSRTSVYSRPVDYPRIVLSVMFLAALAAGAAYYYYAHYLVVNAPYAVSLNGKILAVLRSREEAVQALALIRKAHAPKSPGVVTFVEGEPDIRPYGKASHIRPLEAAASLIKPHLTPVYDGYGLFVNGQPLALMPSEADAWKTISLMLGRGVAGKRGIPTFKQRVVIDHLRLPIEKGQSVLKLPPAETAVEMVHPPRPRVHVVDLGDTFWVIATANGITVDELKALNPGVNYKTLHKGDRIKLPDEPSPVTVVVRAVTVQQEPITAPPPDAYQPAPEPENASATAVNRPPVTDGLTPPHAATGTGGPAATDQRAPRSSDRSVRDNRTPSQRPAAENRRPAADNRAPAADNRVPAADKRAPAAPNRAPRRDSTGPRPSERNTPRSTAPQPPRATRPQPEVRRPVNPPDTQAAPPSTGSTSKSYTDKQMPVKKQPAPEGSGQ